MPGCFPAPGPADQWFWDGVNNGTAHPALRSCGTLRHPPAPMCGECHSVEWTRGVGQRARHGVHVDRVAPPDRARRRTARSSHAGRARRGRAVRLQPHRRRRRRRSPTAWRSSCASRHSKNGRRDVRAAPVQARGVERGMKPYCSDETAIVGIGQTEFSKHSGRSELQLAAEAMTRRGRRCRAHALRHRRCGHLRHGRERRAGRHPLARRMPGTATSPRRTRGGGGGAAATVQLASAAVASGGRRCRGGVPSVQRALGTSVRSAHRGEQPVAGDPTRLELVPALRARHSGEGLLSVVPAVHAHLRGDQRRLRPVPGRRPQARRHQPGRVRTTSSPSRSSNTSSRGGSSNRSCASSTAARRATAAWPW